VRGAKVKSSEIERWITSTSPRPNPLFSLRLFGWKNTKADVAASIALLVLIVASRIAAFPASIWEQDEAYFGCGVVQFDPTSNQPHPPWFPFWMALGKIISPVVAEPTRGLQIASACASVSIVFPLVSLWCIWLRRELAVAAAVLYLFNPAAWVLSGRAFSEPMATMLIVLALALWFDRVPSVSKNLVGSVAGGFCLLTRAHFLIPLAPALLYQVVRSRTRRQRLAVAAPLMVLVAVGYGAVLIDAGGAWHLIEALNNHGNYHFGELAKADLTFDESGIARAFLIPWAGLAWIALAILGAGVAWARGPDFAGFRSFMLLVVLPFVFLVYGISWAGNVRYALPLLALGWGLAMVGLARMAGRWSLPLAALFLISLAGPIAQELKAYRTIASPPMRALEHSLAVARRSGAVIVADRTLASFFDYEQLRHPIPGTVLHDSQIGVDAPPPPEWLTVAIFDNSSDRFVGRTGRTRTFDCQQRWLRRLSQGRFLDITVAEEARVLPIDSRNTALK
jgi:hypothetical protein